MSHGLAVKKSAPHLALLRGVNVGGKNLLPMKLLAQMFVDCGCSDVRTYIQSGNVVFTAPASLLRKLPVQIAKRISDEFGLRVPLVMRSAEAVAATVRNNIPTSRAWRTRRRCTSCSSRTIRMRKH